MERLKFYFALFSTFTALVLGQDKFDVLSVENVPFPESSHIAAVFSAPFTQDISEFTVCNRFMFTSYNDLWTKTLVAYNLKIPI